MVASQRHLHRLLPLELPPLDGPQQLLEPPVHRSALLIGQAEIGVVIRLMMPDQPAAVCLRHQLKDVRHVVHFTVHIRRGGKVHHRGLVGFDMYLPLHGVLFSRRLRPGDGQHEVHVPHPQVGQCLLADGGQGADGRLVHGGILLIGEQRAQLRLVEQSDIGVPVGQQANHQLLLLLRRQPLRVLHPSADGGGKAVLRRRLILGLLLPARLALPIRLHRVAGGLLAAGGQQHAERQQQR